MPQATSAQREPSMEEILASIRRIIEDSDTGKKGEADPVLRPHVQAEAEVDAFRAELRTVPEPARRDEIRANPIVPEQLRPEPVRVERSPERPLEPAARPEPVNAQPPRIEAVPEKKPISLAEIQAEMRKAQQPAAAPAPAVPSAAGPAELELSAGTDRFGAAEPVPMRQDDVRPAVSMADIQALLDKGPPAFSPLDDVADERENDAPAPAMPTLMFEPANRSVAPALAATVAPSVAPVAAVPSTKAPAIEFAPASASKPSIVSEHAGRQVAAAFGELSAAFAASRQKSFDEMAEQMMRPMLQEWMDNNLPLLVERLVREEIERVARGA